MILFAMNWRLALIALVMVPAILLVFVFFRRVGPRFRVMQQKLGQLNTVLQEYLAGLRVVRAFVRESYLPGAACRRCPVDRLHPGRAAKEE